MKMRVGVFFGGKSVEHEISIISALQAMRFLDREKYEVVPVYISKKGDFYIGEALNDIESFRDTAKLPARCRRVIWTGENEKLVLYDAAGGFGRRKPAEVLDFAFPIVHGTLCEDGTLQGCFEMAGVPYAGCDVVSSAVGMDKIKFKALMRSEGLPVLPAVGFQSREWTADRNGILSRLRDEIGFPLIVKPANLGSSVGISRADNEAELLDAVDLAGEFADRLLCERAVTALREINCAVLGDAEEAAASVCEEPVMKDKILSYADKYRSDGSAKGMASLKRRLPAELDEAKTEEIRSLALKTFKVLGCCGVARIDFLMDTADDNRVYVNEINTIPGSLAFYLWEAAGIKYPELLTRIIDLGLRRHRRRKNLMFTYDTDILASGAPFGAKKTGGKIGP